MTFHSAAINIQMNSIHLKEKLYVFSYIFDCQCIICWDFWRVESPHWYTWTQLDLNLMIYCLLFASHSNLDELNITIIEDPQVFYHSSGNFRGTDSDLQVGG
jgi:hypothetical protein